MGVDVKSLLHLTLTLWVSFEGISSQGRGHFNGKISKSKLSFNKYKHTDLITEKDSSPCFYNFIIEEGYL